jgi:hypothetical protein
MQNTPQDRFGHWLLRTFTEIFFKGIIYYGLIDRSRFLCSGMKFFKNHVININCNMGFDLTRQFTFRKKYSAFIILHLRTYFTPQLPLHLLYRQRRPQQLHAMSAPQRRVLRRHRVSFSYLAEKRLHFARRIKRNQHSA